jgi:hypothetical protein
MEGRCRGFSGELFKRQKNRRRESVCYLQMFYVIMQLRLIALDKTTIDQFAAAIAETLARHRMAGPLRELLVGELTWAVAEVLDPLEFESSAAIFDGVHEAIPKSARGDRS